MKRVSELKAFKLLCVFIALYAQRRQLLGQARQHNGSGLGSSATTVRESFESLGGPSLAHPRGKLHEPVSRLLLAQQGVLCRRRMALEQVKG